MRPASSIAHLVSPSNRISRLGKFLHLPKKDLDTNASAFSPVLRYPCVMFANFGRLVGYFVYIRDCIAFKYPRSTSYMFTSSSASFHCLDDIRLHGLAYIGVGLSSMRAVAAQQHFIVYSSLRRRRGDSSIPPPIFRLAGAFFLSGGTGEYMAGKAGVLF